MRCDFAADNLNTIGHRRRAATHLVVTARTDVPSADHLRLCTECAKRYVGGSIEVSNGPQLITVVKL